MQHIQTLSYCAPLIESLRYTPLSPKANLATERLIRRVCDLALPILRGSQALHFGVSLWRGAATVSACGGISWILVPIFAGILAYNVHLLIRNYEQSWYVPTHAMSYLTEVGELFQDLTMLHRATMGSKVAVCMILFDLVYYYLPTLHFGHQVIPHDHWMTESVTKTLNSTLNFLFRYEISHFLTLISPGGVSPVHFRDLMASFEIATTIRHAPTLEAVSVYRHVSSIHSYIHHVTQLLTMPSDGEHLRNRPIVREIHFLFKQMQGGLYYLLNAISNYLVAGGFISVPVWQFSRLTQKDGESFVVFVEGREFEVVEQHCPISLEDWTDQQETVLHLTSEGTESRAHIFSREAFERLNNKKRCSLCQGEYHVP